MNTKQIRTTENINTTSKKTHTHRHTTPKTQLIKDVKLEEKEFSNPEDGGDTFLRNVGSNQGHTVLHPRRRYSSVLY
jgi:hypothetical protein